MNIDKELPGATRVGQTYEPEATKRRREYDAHWAAHYAARAALEQMLKARKARGGPFSDTDLEMIVAHPYAFVRGSTWEGAVSALFARRVSAERPGIRYIGLDAVRTDEGWAKLAYALNNAQTVLAVIDGQDEGVLSQFDPVRHEGDKPHWRLDRELADREHPDLLSVELAVAYGTPLTVRGWWDRIRNG